MVLYLLYFNFTSSMSIFHRLGLSLDSSSISLISLLIGHDILAFLLHVAHNDKPLFTSLKLHKYHIDLGECGSPYHWPKTKDPL